MLKRYIGDRAFYRRVLGIAVPIVIQNGITNFVSLLDNIMVGQVGTVQMSGVSIANQLMLIFNLCIFGATSGAGIFTAQFFGSGDHRGIRHTFRFKTLVCLLLGILGCCVFIFWGEPLIDLYLQGEGDPLAAAQTRAYGHAYLLTMLLGFLPFALTNAYSGTLRETGQTIVPMAAGIAAVLVNLGLNYVLIFGHLGLPALGVQGAAIATVVSRYVELAIVAGWTHLHGEKAPFIRGAYRSLHTPKPLLLTMIRKGFPLLMNEFLWSSGIAVLNQCYSTCGLDVVPALNIAGTIQNLAKVFTLALASSIGIVMGQMLGAQEKPEALQSANRKLMALSLVCGIACGIVLLGVSELFPLLYNTTDSIRALSGSLIRIIGILLPVMAYSLATYFTLRSGGQTFITFLFDSCFTWACMVSLAFVLSRFTAMDVVPLFALSQGMELIKCFLGTWMLKKGIWIRKLTA